MKVGVAAGLGIAPGDLGDCAGARKRRIHEIKEIPGGAVVGP